VDNAIKTMLQQGMAMFQSGQLQQAEKLLREVLAREPREVNALQMLGLTLFQRGNPQEGERLLRKAIRRSPKIAKLHFNLGRMLEMQGKLREAVSAFREARKLDPQDEWIPVNLGIAYGKLNRLDEAVSACKAALKINPENISALSNMGHMLWRNGKLDEAVAALEKALEINPDSIEALSNLGTVYFGEKQLERAEELLRRAYELNPNHGDVLNNLAGVLTAQGEWEEALPLCKQALQMNPRSAELYFNLGRVAHKAEQWEEVISAYSKGLELQPKVADAISGLAEACNIMGRFDEAKQLYYRALELKPDKPDLHAGLLGLEEPSVMLERLERIEKLYKAPDIDEEGKLTLAFALAKFLEKEGEYQRAFQYLDEANRIKRASFEYSQEDERESFELVKSTFTREFFAQRSGYGVASEMPIFILGMPRSGTTLTEQILASHPQVFGAGELKVLNRAVARMCAPVEYLKYPKAVAEWGEGDFTALGEEYLHKLQEYSEGVERVTDKMPHNFFLLGMIHLAMPNAKVIHCRRDPMDNCLSIFKQDFKSMHKYSYDLEELGGHYRRYADLMQHWHNVLPEGTIFDLQYEDMVADQEGMSRKLLEFCELPWDDNCLRFHETKRAVLTASQSQVRKKIYSDSVELWRHYEQQLQPLIKALA
jgi:tetratricopeptide (TPR) repeat protein